MSEVDVGISASNFPWKSPEEKKIFLRLDSLKTEIGIVVDDITAIYVKKRNFPTLILAMVKFYLDVEENNEQRRFFLETIKSIVKGRKS